MIEFKTRGLLLPVAYSCMGKSLKRRCKGEIGDGGRGQKITTDDDGGPKRE